jgi:dynein heavy chain
LAEVTEKVDVLTTKLNKLVSEFDKAMAEKDAALAEAARCATRLDLAQRLVKALGSENERWGNSIQEIGASLELLTGDILMASAFISYTGPFSKKFREQMIKHDFTKYFKDNGIPCSANLNPIKLMTDEASIASWNK